MWASSRAGPPTTQDPAGRPDTLGNTDGSGAAFLGPRKWGQCLQRGSVGWVTVRGEAERCSRGPAADQTRWLLASRKIHLECHVRFSFLYKTE